MDINSLRALAARGSPDARMLLSMMQQQARQQDENDRRWRNMAAYVDRLKAEGKEPSTGKAFLDAFKYCGYVPNISLTTQQQAMQMTFPDFMRACGGFRDLDDYPLKSEPDAPAKCEGCSQVGAGMRCSWCGEWYCSSQCFKQDMKSHLPTCRAAADNIYCAGPPPGRPELWTAQKYATTFGLPGSRAAPSRAGASAAHSTAAHSRAAAPSGAAAKQARVAAMIEDVLSTASAVHSMLQEPVSLTKGQKKNAKKKQKKAAAKAAAAAAGAGDAGGDGSSQQDQDQGQEGGVAGAAAAVGQLKLA